MTAHLRHAPGSLTARILLLLVIALAATWSAQIAAYGAVRAPILHAIHRARNLTWHYDRALGLPLRHYGGAADRSHSRPFRLYILGRWRSNLAVAHTAWTTSPIRSNLLCIHGGEGAWDANTGNGYYGGLQMNPAFELAYAPSLVHVKGHAYRWTPLEQLTAGARAVRVRGYGPWPTTGRACGLIP